MSDAQVIQDAMVEFVTIGLVALLLAKVLVVGFDWIARRLKK